MATEEIDPATTQEWRAWLEANGRSATAVWFVVHHKGSAGAGIPFPEAVEHALCYGWIDGQARKRDVPADLQVLLDADEAAAANFAAMAPSARRAVLEGIARAKRPETRRRRLDEAVRRSEREGPSARGG